MMADPKKLPRTNLEQKIMIIDFFKRSNKPQSDTVEHFKDQFSISTSSFSEWLRHEDELRQRYMKAIDGGNGVSENLKYSKRKATFKYGPINDAMHKVVCERLSMDLPVTEPILRHYWAKFAKEYGITDPKRSDCFSHGWLANFKKRHGLTKMKKPKNSGNNSADNNKTNNEKAKNSNEKQCNNDTPSLDSSVNDNNSDNCSSSGESGTGGSGSFSDGDICNEKSIKELQLSNPTTVSVVSSTYDPITNTHRINTKRQCPHNHGKNCPMNKKRRKNIDDFDYLNANTSNYTYTTYAIPANVPLHDYMDHKSSSNINANSTSDCTLNSNSNSITKKGNSDDNNGTNCSNFNTTLSATNKAVLKNRYKGSNSNSGTLNSLLISNNNGSASGTSSASTTGGDNIPSTGYPVMGAEYQKAESPLISGNGNRNYSSSTHNASNSNNGGAHSQFDIQQILNSQISKPQVSGSSNLNINMNPVNINVLNSRLPYSHFDDSPYSNKKTKSDSINSLKDKKASSTSPSLYNTTLNTNGGAAFQSWSNFSNLTKKHSTNFTISSTTTTTANGSTAGACNTGNSGIQNLLPNILSQGLNLNNTSGKIVDYHTGSDVSRSSIDSNNSNRKITDISDMLDKNEPNSPPPTATTYRHHSNRRMNLPLESLADISASVLSSEISKTMKKSASSGSHKSFKLADDRSKTRFGFNNAENVVGIDDMERLLFVYADRFFKQFKDTEGFEQSKELFDEFKTRFMADKHLYLSSSLSKDNNNDNDNASSSSSSSGGGGNDEEKVGAKERETNGNGRKGYNHGVFFR